MAFVLDASIAAAWALADESHPVADAILSKWLQNPSEQESALVPLVWWFEIRNVLIVNERRKRITPEEIKNFLEDLGSSPIVEDEFRDEAAILKLARVHQLSFYDAAYLELAQRRKLPLATLDKALRAAAEKHGIALLS